MAHIPHLIFGAITLLTGFFFIDSKQALLYTAGILAVIAVLTGINWFLEKLVCKPKSRLLHGFIFICMFLIFAFQLAIIYFTSRMISPFSGTLAFCFSLYARESMVRAWMGSSNFIQRVILIVTILSGVILLFAQLYFESKWTLPICMIWPAIYFYYKLRSMFVWRNRKGYGKPTPIIYPILLKLLHLTFSIGKSFKSVRVGNLFYTLNKSKKTATLTSETNDYDERLYVGDITIPSEITYGFTTYKVTDIDDYAFRESSVKSVTLPESIKDIGYCAFYKCSELKSVILNDGLLSISGIAFANCYGLTEITIPESVAYIGSEAFTLCSELRTVRIYRNTPPETSDNSFLCPSNSTLYVPKGAKEAYKGLPWKKFNIVEMD